MSERAKLVCSIMAEYNSIGMLFRTGVKDSSKDDLVEILLGLKDIRSIVSGEDQDSSSDYEDDECSVSSACTEEMDSPDSEECDGTPLKKPKLVRDHHMFEELLNRNNELAFIPVNAEPICLCSSVPNARCCCIKK